MKAFKRSIGAAAAGALALSGVAGLSLLTASSAEAATSNNTQDYSCDTVVTSNSDPLGPPAFESYDVINNFTMTLNAPNSVIPGDDITVTGTYSPAQLNGPTNLSAFVASQNISVSYDVNGGASTVLQGAEGAATAPATILPSNGTNGPQSLPNPDPGAVTIDTTGTVDGDAVNILPAAHELNYTSSSLGGVTGQTICTVVAPGANALTVDIINAASADVTAVAGQTNPDYARAGQVATLSGSSWAASNGEDLTAQFCDNLGAACGAAATDTLDVTAGALSGTVTVPVSGAGTGARTIKVTAPVSGQSVDIPINLLGTRTASISPTQGSTLTEVDVTVSNFDTGQDFIAFGGSEVQSFGGAFGVSVITVATGDVSAAPVAASSTGTGTNSVIINSASTIAVSAYQGTSLPGVFTPASPAASIGPNTPSNFTFGVNSCTVDADPAPGEESCYVLQFINMTVNGGVLTLSQLDGSIAMTDVTLDGSENTSTGAINQLTINDARGTDAGWSITGSVTDFEHTTSSTGNVVIPNTNLSWTPACDAANVETTGTALPAAAASFVAAAESPAGSGADAAAALCSVAPNEGGGIWTADAGLSLIVPPSVKAGDYQATLYLTIS
jgi:hypothetical protein